MDSDICAGRSDAHIEYRSIIDHSGHSRTVGLQSAVWQAFARLSADAAEAGIRLCIASGFRSFERQLAIWNAKATGERPVLDSHGHELDVASLADTALCNAIMRWSALPGASRHHWGTDLDVYDQAAVEPAFRLQLVPEEYSPGGPFARFADWFAAREACQETHGFYRPYAEDHGGVAPEPWHLSYAPLADPMLEYWSIDKVAQCLEATPQLQLRAAVMAGLGPLYDRFVRVAPGGSATA